MSLVQRFGAGLQRAFGFKNARSAYSYAILAGISLIFVAHMWKAVFIKSWYCAESGEHAPPGECYWFLKPGSRYYYGIQLHLASCLPALSMAVLQFTPRIRQKYRALHRWLGRVTTVLALIATSTALLLGDAAFGGTTATLSSIILLACLSFLGHYKAWTAIRARQVHLHRRWMLRTWTWLGSIITMRPLFLLGGLFITTFPRRVPYNEMPISCKRLFHAVVRSTYATNDNRIDFFRLYPECVREDFDVKHLRNVFLDTINDSSRHMAPILEAAIKPDGYANVSGKLTSSRLDQMMAAVDITFGVAFWAAIILHLVAIELYLWYTTAEDRRLARLSVAQNTKSEKIK